MPSMSAFYLLPPCRSFAYLGIKFHIAEEPDKESVDNRPLQAIGRDAVPHIWHLSRGRGQAGKLRCQSLLPITYGDPGEAQGQNR